MKIENPLDDDIEIKMDIIYYMCSIPRIEHNAIVGNLSFMLIYFLNDFIHDIKPFTTIIFILFLICYSVTKFVCRFSRPTF